MDNNSTNNDYDYLEVLYNKLLIELTDSLNIFHNESHSSRYWEILIGHWLRQYLKVIINRYRTVESVVNNYEISGTSIHRSNYCDLATKNTIEFQSAMNNSTWNSILFAKILSRYSEIDFPVEVLDIDYKIDFFSKRNITIRKKAFIFCLSLLNKIHRKSDAFIVKSYLSIANEIKLQLSLIQFPQLWITPDIDMSDMNLDDRSKFSIDCDGYKGLEEATRKLIVEMLPTCYLEGYKSIVNQAIRFSWPKDPKFIFTSNSFAYDEGFKFWTAMKVNEGVLYYTGQHGSNYGTSKYLANYTELTTCDKFLSWGWADAYKNINVVPAFNFKTVSLKGRNYDKKGKLLLIERGPGLHDGPYDRQYKHQMYQKDMLSFYDCFPNRIKSKFIVRLHHGSTDLESSDELLWNRHSKNISIDTGVESINNLIGKSRIVVITYDSSAVLELLNLNVPIVCFWRDTLDDLLPDAIPFYELLIEAGIVYISPEAAAKHITACWNDVDLWWGSEEVQNARKIFCNKYSKRVINPIFTLRKLLLDNL
jgi:putative transferase (TIGR04331 family)